MNTGGCVRFSRDGFWVAVIWAACLGAVLLFLWAVGAGAACPCDKTKCNECAPDPVVTWESWSRVITCFGCSQCSTSETGWIAVTSSVTDCSADVTWMCGPGFGPSPAKWVVSGGGGLASVRVETNAGSAVACVTVSDERIPGWSSGKSASLICDAVGDYTGSGFQDDQLGGNPCDRHQWEVRNIKVR